MTKIYELKQQQQELLDELYWLDPDDPDNDCIADQLERIEGSVERKLSYLSDVLAEAIALAQLATERRKIAAERLERKEKQAQRAETKLREFILSVMHDFDIKQVKGDLLNVSRYERETLIQTHEIDVNTFPDEYCRIKREIDKTKINEAYKIGGVKIDGFELVKKDCLRVS